MSTIPSIPVCVIRSPLPSQQTAVPFGQQIAHTSVIATAPAADRGPPPFWVPLVSGMIAGGIETITVWPMEFIKTQLQLNSPTNPLPYNSMSSGFKWTIKNNGFLGLYRGLAPTLIGSIPKAGIRFSLNAEIKGRLRDSNGALTPSKNFLAGLGAGVSEALIIVAPVETVKTKCIDMNVPFLSGMKTILKNEGISGVYQGAAATAMKQGSNQGLRFMWFNEYKTFVTNNGETQMTPLKSLFGGMSAGCFSTLGNNPFDVVKTRMQGTEATQYKGTVDCFKQIFGKEGVGGFYKGVGPRLMRVVPGQGVIFMSFEGIQQQVRKAAGV
ncbi:hypothetical protein TrVE_jg14120 [Triparma verrucosa]|uniref:Mitochondrial carrier n=1 Tax=Triparma verrucosa TaxID=1606542 RepID=A0A9W7BQ94_9STRA|nr:hypothetical protein TrVE_jg14120 [Triparma verrucosa]